MFTYSDKNGQTIYYDLFTRKAYAISPSKEKQFSVLNNYMLYSALSFAFAYALFNLSLPLSIAIAILVFIISVWRLHRFLGKCTFISSFKYERSNNASDSELSNGLILIKAGAYLALGALLIISVTAFKADNSLVFALFIALAIASFYVSLKYLSIIIARKKLQ